MESSMNKYAHFSKINIYNKDLVMLKSIYKPVTTNITTHLRWAFSTFKFTLPDLGEKIKEGTIKKLYVKQGDQVAEFQKLADVASDKQFTEITASEAGVIKKIHYKEEDVCQVGALFLEIELADAKKASESQKKQPQQVKVNQPTVQPTRVVEKSGENTILATPYVRGLIKQRKLDITKIKGTGPNGRILQSDVVSHSQQKKQQKGSVSTKYETKAPTPSPVRQLASHVIKMSNFEKGMQKSMTQSNKIPHLYLHEEFDITETQKMRKAIKSNDKKVTLMGILIKTFSLALRKYPIMNAVYEPQKNQFEYTIKGEHNISIAIDSPNGLVVPNIKNVQQLNLLKIQSELQRLRQLAADAKLTSKQLNGGTVCLSNIGTIGGVNACPLILAPQVCIVAIGKMQTLPKYVKDALVPRTTITVSYGCDHRVIDGATVARFSNEWKRLLETPYLALAQMN